MKYYKDINGNVYAYEADGSQDQYIPDTLIPITLDEANLLRKPKLTTDEVWELIKAERDKRKASGVLVGTYIFHTDDSSRIQYGILDSKATRDSLPADTVLHPQWKTVSGDKVPMTVTLLRQVIDAGITREAAIFDVAEAHKTAMIASPDPSLYDFSTGWPA